MLNILHPYIIHFTFTNDLKKKIFVKLENFENHIIYYFVIFIFFQQDVIQS